MAKKKKQYKKVQITLEFTASEVYPDDDFESLHQNVYSLLNGALVVGTLMKKIKILGTDLPKKSKGAYKEVLSEEERIGREMVNSMKVKVA